MTIPPVIALMGPTASGKTQLAVELVAHFPVEIISVDSALIYQEMDIGTAKPDLSILQKAPHHLIDLIPPDETYSVARFCEEALTTIKAIYARGNIPLLVGGTMMYFHALFHGMDVLPESDEIVRDELTKQAEINGLESLYRTLFMIDPQTAARLEPTDKQRILRALEVFKLTGQPMSSLLQRQNRPPFSAFDYPLLMLHLVPSDRTTLHKRIQQRFLSMLKDHFIEEVVYLKEKYCLTREMPAMRCVGYRQALDYLDSPQTQADYAVLEERGIVATRQLAKRQLTWLRNQPRAAQSYELDCLNLEQSYREIARLIAAFV